MMGVDVIRREVERAKAGVRQAFRGLLGSLDKAKRVQLANLDGVAGEALPAMELFQQFGFTSAPPAGTQLIVLPLGGKTSAAVIVASEHGAYRLQLGADGECAIYNQWGDHVWLKQNGEMVAVASAKITATAPIVNINAATSVTVTSPNIKLVASTKIEVTSPLVTMSQDLQVAGLITAANLGSSGSITATNNITAGGDVADQGGTKTMRGMRTVYNTHNHANPEGGRVGSDPQAM